MASRRHCPSDATRSGRTVPLVASPGDELVEEVDRGGRVLRIVTRAEMRAGRLRHRTTFIAVIDRAGRILLHQRSPHKDVWPSRWDLAAGGVLAVDEDWADGARRELAEELGVEAEVEELGRGTFDDDEVRTVAAVFLARHDGPVSFADGEVVAAEWATANEVEDAIRTRAFVPDSVALVWPLVRPLLP